MEIRGDQIAAPTRFDPVTSALLLLIAALLLQLLARNASALSCAALALSAVLVSFPLALQRVYRHLLIRRFLLSATMTEESAIRHWLHRGRWTALRMTLTSLALAAVLLILLAQLPQSGQRLYLYTGVLLLDAVCIAGLFHGFRHSRWATQFQHERRDDILLAGPLLWGNSLLLMLALLGLDFFLGGAADTRGLDWQTIVIQHFSAAREAAACPLWGLASGLLAALDGLGWHAAESLIPQLPSGLERGLAWVLFLLREGGFAWLYSLFLIGVLRIHRSLTSGRIFSTQSSDFMRGFVLMLLFLVGLRLYVAQLSSASLPSFPVAVAVEVEQQKQKQKPDPCAFDPELRASLREGIEERIDADLRRLRTDALVQADTQIEERIDALFNGIESGLDDYLDWFYSVGGEYQRLAAAVTGDATTSLAQRLEQHLFASVDMEAELKALEDALAEQASAAFAALVPELNGYFADHPCAAGDFDLAPLEGFDHDGLRASAAAASGLAAGVGAKLLAKKATTSLMGKLMAKEGFKTSAKLVGKMLAKKGTSAAAGALGGAAVCAPAGPVALVCGALTGLFTWVAADQLFVKIDEVLNREELKLEMLDAIRRQRAELTLQLKQRQWARVEALSEAVRGGVERVFVPYSDGL